MLDLNYYLDYFHLEIWQTQNKIFWSFFSPPYNESQWAPKQLQNVIYKPKDLRTFKEPQSSVQ